MRCFGRFYWNWRLIESACSDAAIRFNFVAMESRCAKIRKNNVIGREPPRIESALWPVSKGSLNLPESPWHYRNRFENIRQFLNFRLLLGATAIARLPWHDCTRSDFDRCRPTASVYLDILRSPDRQKTAKETRTVGLWDLCRCTEVRPGLFIMKAEPEYG